MVLGSPERHEMYLMNVSNEKLLGQLCMVKMGDITTNTFMCHHSYIHVKGQAQACSP